MEKGARQHNSRRQKVTPFIRTTFCLPNIFSLEGKTALITGGSYGIGFAIASALAQAGAKIAFNGRDRSRLDSGIQAYKDEGINAHGYVSDVTDEAAVIAMV
jgi:gluconate 5-dehydrogenase